MRKKKSSSPNPEEDKELLRAFINAFQAPENEDPISLEDDSFFEKIYGIEELSKRKIDRAKKVLEEKKRLG